MNRHELLALPVSVDVVTAGRALGLGRTQAYALAKTGEFPTPVLKLGSRYRVVTADLWRLLGVHPEQNETAPVAHGDRLTSLSTDQDARLTQESTRDRAHAA